MLNKIGQPTEPWGTLEMIYSYELEDSFFFSLICLAYIIIHQFRSFYMKLKCMSQKRFDNYAANASIFFKQGYLLTKKLFKYLTITSKILKW